MLIALIKTADVYNTNLSTHLLSWFSLSSEFHGYSTDEMYHTRTTIGLCDPRFYSEGVENSDFFYWNDSWSWRSLNEAQKRLRTGGNIQTSADEC
jgi:hypothetical protein